MRPRTLLAITLFGATMVAGILLGGIWLYLAFAGMMVVMHLFGHGGHGHGGQPDEREGHGDEGR